jgi:TRAP-type mannitol/chloroaromatic compound transport system permease small subunit
LSWWARAVGGLSAVGTVWIFGLMALSVADVVGRDAFQAPVRGTTELLGLSIVGIVWLQLANSVAAGRLTRSDTVIDAVRRRSPRVAAALDAFYMLAGAGLMAVIAAVCIGTLREAIEIGDYVGAVGDFTFPTWPVRTLMLIGAIAGGVQFLLMAFAHARAALRPPS